MMNGKLNFILKVMFWITRQPVNQMIDNPDSPPQRQEGGTNKYLPLLQSCRVSVLCGD